MFILQVMQFVFVRTFRKQLITIFNNKQKQFLKY